MLSFVCMQFIEEPSHFDPFSVGKGYSIDLPTVTSMMTRLVGSKLDYNNLSDEELQSLILNEKTNVIHFPEFDPETIEMAAQEIYSYTHKYIPNIIYAPENFDVSNLNGSNYNLHHSKVLKENQLVMLVADDLAFPAYKDLDNNIQIHNPGLLMLIEVSPTLVGMGKLDAERDAALEANAIYAQSGLNQTSKEDQEKLMESYRQATDRDQSLEMLVTTDE